MKIKFRASFIVSLVAAAMTLSTGTSMQDIARSGGTHADQPPVTSAGTTCSARAAC